MTAIESSFWALLKLPGFGYLFGLENHVYQVDPKGYYVILNLSKKTKTSNRLWIIQKVPNRYDKKKKKILNCFKKALFVGLAFISLIKN